MTKKRPEEEKTSWLSTIKIPEAAKIALIPVAAQLILFVYEYGFYGVFQIPITLISFDWGDLFIVTGAILGLGAIVYYYGDMLLSAIRTTSEPIRDKLLRGYGGFLFLIVLFFAYGPRLWREWITPLIALILILLYEFVLPLVQFRGKGSYREKLEAHAKQRADREKKKRSESTMDKLMRQLGPRTILFLLVLYGIYHLGRAAAMTQQEFLVANTNPEMAVLWMGDDRFIVAPFDRVTKTIGRGFQILLVGQDPTISFNRQKIGPLSLSDQIISPTLLPTLQPSEPAATTSIPTPTSKPTYSISATQTLIPTVRKLQPSASYTPMVSPTQ